MMKIRHPIVIRRDQITVDARITGPRGTITSRFIVDTGAAVTTLSSRIADRIGYSARDGVKVVTIRTPIAEETGYSLYVSKLSVLGLVVPRCFLHVFDLTPDLGGLLGMNVLRNFNFEVRPIEEQMLLEQVAQRR